MAAISKEDLKIEILAILRSVDLTTTSSKKVRTDIEQKLNVQLADRKKEISDVIEQYVAENHQNNDDEEDEDDDDDDDDDDDAAANSDSSDGSDSDSVEEPAPKKRAAATAAKSKSKAKASSDDDGKSRKKPAAAAAGKGKGNSFTRPFKLSPELASLMGEEHLPRHEVVRKVWALIKERNLYDPKNKQFAICDADLMTVIGVKRFRTFGMLKYLKKHFVE